ncbi:MAG: hypothetical protein H0V66_13040 [Bdellovibrionales bacterium]|nr:hypothetical protein [Bdellovibrionales bacterium]
MFNLILYSFILFGLVYWVESQSLVFSQSLIIKKNAAEELEDWLKKFSWSSRQELTSSNRLPSYKFYSEVIEILLAIARKMGGTYQDSILFLREGLQADRQFEKKLKEIILGTWLQMGMMLFLTWAFITGSLFLVDIKVSVYKLAMIAIWQGIGMASLPFIISFFRKKFFQDIGKLWKMLYVLRSLTKVPLSRTEILTIAGVTEIKNIQQKSLIHIVDKLKETCQKALQLGGSYEEEVVSLMSELRFQEKWHFELFEKRLMVIKLGIMSIFFLPSYLAFIFLLLGDLLTLM